MFEKYNLRWIVPIILFVIPMVILTKNIYPPALSYLGTTGIWKLVDKIWR